MPFELLKKKSFIRAAPLPSAVTPCVCQTGMRPGSTSWSMSARLSSSPLDGQGNLLFVRQYRHAAGLDLLELPAGTLNKDEAPDACAHREIREETGMAAGYMRHLGGFYLAPGYSTEYMHVYLATDLRSDPLEADADEFLTVESIPLARAMANARAGKILDAKSLAALLLAQSVLEK